MILSASTSLSILTVSLASGLALGSLVFTLLIIAVNVRCILANASFEPVSTLPRTRFSCCCSVSTPSRPCVSIKVPLPKSSTILPTVPGLPVSLFGVSGFGGLLRSSLVPGVLVAGLIPAAVRISRLRPSMESLKPLLRLAGSLNFLSALLKLVNPSLFTVLS